MVAENDAWSINYIKTKSSNTQQNRKCRLCGDRDEMVNHIISDYGKQA